MVNFFFFEIVRCSIDVEFDWDFIQRMDYRGKFVEFIVATEKCKPIFSIRSFGNSYVYVHEIYNLQKFTTLCGYLFLESGASRCFVVSRKYKLITSSLFLLISMQFSRLLTKIMAV